MSNLSNVEILAAVIIAILSVARMARLLIHDEFPPTMWLRMKWDDATGDSDWNTLLHCQFCLSFWLMVGMAGWAYLSDLHWTWWWANAIFGCSYIAAIVVSYDESA